MTKRSLLSVCCAVLLVLSLICGRDAVAGDRSPSLEEALKTLAPDYELPVIIQMSDQAVFSAAAGKGKQTRTAMVVRALKSRADSSQAGLKAFLKLKNTREMKSLWIINGIAAKVPVRLIAEIEKFPGVESIEPDYTVHAPVVRYGSLALPEANLESIRAPEVWDLGDRGSGVVVASIDTGIDINHPDLAGKWRGGANSWYDPNGEHSAPHDADGHGTMTTGVMVGGSSGGTAIGVAPDAKWIAVKIFNDKGDSMTSNIHEGFQWLLDPDSNPETDDAPDVVNASWGLVDSTGTCVRSFQQDIQNLRAAGIAVVFAAGNEGAPGPSMTNSSDSPANNAGAFAVGAVDNNNVIAYFSSRGPSACDGGIFPHVVAPGVDIKTSGLTSGGVVLNSYSYVSGTSFSAPHVAGAIALLKSAFPDKTIEEIELSLEQSALDLGVPEGDNTYGYGLIDVLSAYNSLKGSNSATPKIEASPASYNFGEARTGTVTAPVSFTFSSKGTSALQMGAAYLAGPDAADFRIFSDSCSGGTLGVQSSCTLEIYFMPSSAGTKSALLYMPSNDPLSPALSLSLTGTGASPESLTVISPNGAEEWTAGMGKTIRWTFSGSPGPFVRIELIKSGTLVRTISARVSASRGYFDWTVPARQTPGSDYRIRVRSTSDIAYTDTSDADFSIVSPPPPSISVTSPGGGEVWQRGSSQIIGWTFEGKTGAYVRIRLFKGGKAVRTIASSVKIGSDGSGSFIWRIPEKLSQGVTYQVKVSSRSRGTVNDISNGTFTIE